ncbi:MAG: molybdenum cofactor guanylyltransferase MobA [Pseudomonadota bacterium]
MSETIALPPCSVLLLAGGRGQRMGGQDKGLLTWRDLPLIAHLHRLTRGLTDDLIISCNRNVERYAAFADHLVQDEDGQFSGPLAGIRAGLAVARHAYLLVLPCDAPRLDAPLLQALRQAALAHPGKPVMLRQGSQWEPLFSLIPASLGEALEQAWQAGERSPRQLLLALGAVALDCPSADPRLANLNTPELLALHAIEGL